MLYLSQLLGSPVEDAQGARVGRIIDVIVGTRSSASSTPVSLAPAVPSSIPGLLIEGQDDQHWLVPAGAVEQHDSTLLLRIPLDQLTLQPGERAPQQVSLAREVLDKQVIDIEHKKAVRVNDVCLGDDWQILGVDNSTLGLVRRLAPAWLLGARSKRTPAALIPWERIELIGEQEVEEEDSGEAATEPRLSAQAKPARQQSGQLAELRPADIADIVHQLTPGQGAHLIEGLDDKTAADALEEIDTDRQSHILESIDVDRAAAILAAMEPDEAADLLARLPEERAQELLRRMKPEDSEEVQELLEYEEDTAGGLMTNSCVAVTSTKTVGEALDELRMSIRELEMRPAYIYCIVDEAQEDYHLLGKVSVWDLLVADSSQPLQEIMETDVVTVPPDADPQDVAEIMAKYNLLAVPVVSEGNILEGVVTVDDALDVLLPEDRRRKPTRMY
jgi:CBS domain-containing protein/sporulation protein YlmC with PRC-barrel domain